MEGEEREKEKAKEIGGEAVDGAQTECGLQGDEASQQSADVVGFDCGVGAGFVACQEGDRRNIESEHAGGDDGSGCEEEFFGCSGGPEQ